MAAVIAGMQALLLPFRDCLSADNFSRVVLAAAETAALLLERAVMQCRFNRVRMRGVLEYFPRYC